MKIVNRYMTHDGKTFETRRDAETHLNNAIHRQLTEISNALANKKFVYVFAYVPQYLDQFTQLQRLLDDLNEVPNDEE